MLGAEREAKVIRSGLLLALAIAVLSSVGSVARAFPDRPIKLVVPFPAGGATDTATRLVARGTSTVLGQPILIENQGGAGGTIALKQVIGAPADGYTLMSVGVSNTFVTQMILFNLDFDPAKLLTPVALTTIDPGVLVVNAGVPVNTIDELVAYAKANPGKLNYGSSIGIGPHFIVELFKRAAGVDIVHVPYRGGGPMVTDLVAGQVQMTVNGKSVLLPHIQSGKLKALAVTGDKRWPELPGVPTFVETGYLKDNYDSVFGIVAPTGTPQRIIEQLNRSINDALRNPDVRDGLAKLGIEPNPGSVKNFSEFIAEVTPRWKEIVRVTGIKVGG
jgi:tripartite-type tricarboxylate transporter receptor subunit TctC